MSSMPAPQERPYFITIKEAASILRISEYTMGDIVRGNGKSGPRVVKLNGRYRIPYTEFMEWVNSQVYVPKRRKK